MTEVAAGLFTFEEVAEATGRHVRMVYRAAKDGELGEVHGSRPAKVTAGAVHAWLGRPVKLQHKPAPVTLGIEDINLIARKAAEQRDNAWVRWLSETKMQYRGGLPPFDGFYEKLAAYQNTYTTSQVHDLLRQAAAERDRTWRQWSRDARLRAMQPDGPGPFIADKITKQQGETA